MDKVQVTVLNPNNPRKIPEAYFIQDVESYVNQHTATRLMEALQEAYSRYKLLESQLLRQKESMKQKIPEIEKTLAAINHLENNQDEEQIVDFMLAETIWTRGKIKKGASTMVEYSLSEAKVLLIKNQENAAINLKSFESDLDFLKDQITTIEVNIARVHNQNVKMMQEAKKKENK